MTQCKHGRDAITCVVCKVLREKQGCKHLGTPTGELVSCEMCRGRVQLKVMTCTLHEKCTVGRKIANLQCCKTCDDYLASE
jgi:hypothetical protein